MSFTNLYYKRTAGTAKACWVCYNPTTTVLATVNTVDFIYVCDGHLKDPGFAALMGETSDGVEAGGVKKMGLSPEEIAKVKAEWEERHKKKQKAKEKEKEKDKDNDKGKEEDKDDQQDKKDTPAKSKSPVSSPISSTAASPRPPTTPTHQRFTLHRDIFAMRLAEHRKRRQMAQAKEIAPRLPTAPRAPVQGP